MDIYVPERGIYGFRMLFLSHLEEKDISFKKLAVLRLFLL